MIDLNKFEIVDNYIPPNGEWFKMYEPVYNENIELFDFTENINLLYYSFLSASISISSMMIIVSGLTFLIKRKIKYMKNNVHPRNLLNDDDQ